MNRVTRKLIKGMLGICLLVGSQLGYGQHVHFVESGKIEFEKRVNMFAKMRARVTNDNVYMQKMYEDYLKNQPQFMMSKTLLSFNKSQSIYQVVEEADHTISFFTNREPWVAVKNTVLTDFGSDSVTTLKKIFEDDFVVRDKRANIIWKYTNEVRDIAGYKCRRANGLILDSIYVVAFYTEEIITSGGPESFSDLPGMILGVALPHENVTWFATKVEVDRLDSTKMPVGQKKAEQVSREQLKEYLQKNLKNWGTNGTEALKAFLL